MINETIELLLQRGDGTVTVMSYVVADLIQTYDASAEAIEAHIRRYFPDTISWRALAAGETFTFAASYSDPYFGAWTCDNGGTVTHHMGRAREIHRGRIRAQRAPLLEEQDRALMFVDEDEALSAAERQQRRRAITAKKRALRDAPADPRIDQASTIEQLKAVDPLKD